MAPHTTEEEIERRLYEAEQDLKNSSFKLKTLRKEVSDAEDNYVERSLLVDKIKEELRRFRDMFPSHCKDPKQ